MASESSFSANTNTSYIHPMSPRTFSLHQHSVTTHFHLHVNVAKQKSKEGPGCRLLDV